MISKYWSCTIRHKPLITAGRSLTLEEGIMKTKVITLLVLLYAATIPFGCKNATEPVVSRTDLLTATPWQIQKAVVPGSPPTDITNQISYLTITFTKDGKYTTAVISGTWEFIEQEKKILFDKNSSTQYTGEIMELSASAFRMTIANPPLSGASLIDITFTPAPAATNTSPTINFDTLWKEFDNRYSFFEIKKINWDSLYAVYRPQVTSQTSDNQLFQIMSQLLANLKDGHVNLATPFGSYYYNRWYAKYPTNFLGLNAVARYFVADYGSLAGGMMRYGKVTSDIGYLYIGPNLMGDIGVWSQAIDVVIDALKGMKGIIVDIRSNGGGNDGLGAIVASRFADQQRAYSYIRWRQGPKHSDFTDFQAATIAPQGVFQYKGPVVLLTNRSCFSSAEGTILMFRVLPNVTSIGDTTGGGSANPIALQLPNGWSYRVSRWIQYTAQKTVFEGIGLPPDIPVRISVADSAAGRDAILERAIQRLSGQ